MIRSVAITRNSDNDVLLQILLDRDGVEYKTLSKYDMLNMIEVIAKYLAEDEMETILKRG